MYREQDNVGKSFDMAGFVAELVEDPQAADEYREHAQATQLIKDFVAERLRHGLSQRDMARRLGVAPGTISRFEDRADDELEIGMLSRYADALGFRMTIQFEDKSQGDASRIKACVFSIQRQLQNLTDIARKHLDDKALCDGIAQFQAEVLLNFLIKYGESADLPRVVEFIAGKGEHSASAESPQTEKVKAGSRDAELQMA